MLEEAESRILTLGMDALSKDFEPLEAVPYMFAKQIFGENEVDVINALVSWILFFNERFFHA